MRVKLLAALWMVLACSCAKKSEPPPGTSPGGPLTTGAGGATAAGGSGPAGGGAGAGVAGASGAGGTAGTGAGAGVPCGSKTCAAGQICCNASCGICTPPDGFCTQQLCNEADAAAPSGGGACKADGDCRLFDDYCTGCDCRALSSGEKNPTCSGPGVRCLVAPCRDKRAACQNGRCTAVPAQGTRR